MATMPCMHSNNVGGVQHTDIRLCWASTIVWLSSDIITVDNNGQARSADEQKLNHCLPHK